MAEQIDHVFSGRITQDELDRLIKMHEDFLGAVRGGKRLILQFMNLSGLDFSGRNLADAIFTGSALIKCDFSNAKMDRVNLFSCDMRYANFENASLVRADMRGVCARGARLNNADLLQADMRVGQVLTHERSGELQALYYEVPEPSSDGQTDFSQAVMKKACLNEAQAAHADFSDAEMQFVKMRNAHLVGASFEGANLEKGDFSGADLTSVNMRDAVIVGAQMAASRMDGANLEGSVQDADHKNTDALGRSIDEMLTEHQLWVRTAGKQGSCLDLSGFDLRQGMNLQNGKLTAIRANSALFMGMDLKGIELQHSFLDHANFRNAVLIGADFRGSTMRQAKMSRADLRKADFQPLTIGGRVKVVDLSGANLRYADLRDANFSRVILKGADLSHAQLDGADFTGADLSGLQAEGANSSAAKGFKG